MEVSEVDGQVWTTPNGNGSSASATTKLRHLWSLVVVALVLGAVAGAIGGFAASGLHPGPRGHVGATGLKGAQGAQGPRGLDGIPGSPGSDASVADLGVCWSTSSQWNLGASWISSVSLSSPSKHPDGTTYCPYGTYVAVAPQG
jgi:hypothetical protein